MRGFAHLACTFLRTYTSLPYRFVKKYFMGKICYFNSILLLQNQNFYYLYIAKRIQRLIEKQFSTDVF